MKNVVFAVLVVLLFATVASAEININMGGATTEVVGVDTIRVHHLTATGFPGSYQVDFKWDQVNLIFIPTTVTQEAQPQPQPTGKPCSWLVTDGYGDDYQFTITSDPLNRLLIVSYRATAGAPVICFGTTFVQGTNQFGLADWSGGVDAGTALITYGPDFDGCGSLYNGQSISGFISYIPSWFDFTKTFAVSFGAAPMYCEPDGTTHK